MTRGMESLKRSRQFWKQNRPALQAELESKESPEKPKTKRYSLLMRFGEYVMNAASERKALAMKRYRNRKREYRKGELNDSKVVEFNRN